MSKNSFTSEECEGVLTSADHEQLTRWLTKLFERCMAGQISIESSVGELGQVIGAVDIRNIGEVRAWISGRNDKDDE